MNSKETVNKENTNSGILIIPANKNGDTLLNILTIFLKRDEQDEEINTFPEIGEVVFLQTIGLDEIKFEGKEYIPAAAYELMLKKIGKQNVITRVIAPINNSGVDIPNIIRDAVKKRESQNYIVLDLTNGSKQITGALYTSGTLCGITNMVYVEVFRDEAGAFHKLWEKNSLSNKYKIQRFDAMKDLENLASLNNIEFVMYRKIVGEIKENCSYEMIRKWCNKLDRAISAYFIEEQHVSCIREIGEVNEELITIIEKWIINNPPIAIDTRGDINEKAEPEKPRIITLLNENKVGSIENKPIYLANKNYNTSLNSLQSNNNNTIEKADIVKKCYGRVFMELPNLYYLLSALRIYRNVADHPKEIDMDREDAKLAIDMIIKIIGELSKCEAAEELFK